MKAVLAELKVQCCCTSRYPIRRTERQRMGRRSVDQRADGLHAVYQKKAKDVDQKYRETPGGEQGPVERKLAEFGQVRGLCFGAFGEASEQVHLLVEHMAESRVRHGVMFGRNKGTPLQRPAAKAMVMGQLRRELSIVAHRAQARLLLANIWQVGDGADVAAERRRRAQMQHGREADMDRALWVSHERSFASAADTTRFDSDALRAGSLGYVAAA